VLQADTIQGTCPVRQASHGVNVVGGLNVGGTRTKLVLGAREKKQLLPAARASELPAEKGSHLSGVNFLCHARGLSGQPDSSHGGFLTAQFLAELFGVALTHRTG